MFWQDHSISQAPTTPGDSQQLGWNTSMSSRAGLLFILQLLLPSFLTPHLLTLQGRKHHQPVLRGWDGKAQLVPLLQYSQTALMYLRKPPMKAHMFLQHFRPGLLTPLHVQWDSDVSCCTLALASSALGLAQGYGTTVALLCHPLIFFFRLFFVRTLARQADRNRLTLVLTVTETLGPGAVSTLDCRRWSRMDTDCSLEDVIETGAWKWSVTGTKPSELL